MFHVQCGTGHLESDHACMYRCFTGVPRGVSVWNKDDWKGESHVVQDNVLQYLSVGQALGIGKRDGVHVGTDHAGRQFD